MSQRQGWTLQAPATFIHRLGREAISLPNASRSVPERAENLTKPKARISALQSRKPRLLAMNGKQTL
jgi:hypothetical protein